MSGNGRKCGCEHGSLQEGCQQQQWLVGGHRGGQARAQVRTGSARCAADTAALLSRGVTCTFGCRLPTCSLSSAPADLPCRSLTSQRSTLSASSRRWRGRSTWRRGPTGWSCATSGGGGGGGQAQSAQRQRRAPHGLPRPGTFAIPRCPGPRSAPFASAQWHTQPSVCRHMLPWRQAAALPSQNAPKAAPHLPVSKITWKLWGGVPRPISP